MVTATKRVTFKRGDIRSAIDAARRLKSDKDLYIVPTAEGFTIEKTKPPTWIRHVLVKPDGTYKRISPYMPTPITPEPKAEKGEALEEIYAREYRRWAEGGYKGLPPKEPEGVSKDFLLDTRIEIREAIKKDKPITPRPKAEKAQARYKELMKPRLEAHDKEIKAVNDDFMAGKMTPKEMEGKHKAIHKKTDAVAATMRKKAWGEYPETLPSRAELEKVQRMRSPRSQASDLARRHSVVISPDNPKVATWLHDQGSADISGIDTPRLTRKTPRITPKRPRLKR